MLVGDVAAAACFCLVTYANTISFSAIKQLSEVCKLSGNEQAVGIGCSKM